MPQILVTKPFRVQFAPGKKGLREFEPGKHDLTGDELNHWFVQGCISEGRAVVASVPEQAMETVAPGAPANHDEFADAMNLTIGIDLAAEGTGLTGFVEYADGVVQSMAQIPAATAPAKTAAKPKAKGK